MYVCVRCHQPPHMQPDSTTFRCSLKPWPCTLKTSSRNLALFFFLFAGLSSFEPRVNCPTLHSTTISAFCARNVGHVFQQRHAHIATRTHCLLQMVYGHRSRYLHRQCGAILLSSCISAVILAHIFSSLLLSVFRVRSVSLCFYFSVPLALTLN